MAELVWFLTGVYKYELIVPQINKNIVFIKKNIVFIIKFYNSVLSYNFDELKTMCNLSTAYNILYLLSS